MKNLQPIILVTNDDGIYAPGLKALVDAVSQLGRAIIVAPEQDNSAVSHTLTMHRPLLVKERGQDIFSINGTPTDCVTLGIGRILPAKPALVVSGINPGGNLGDDVSYSGTVSAAIEGTMHGVPSLAFSLVGEDPFHFATAAGIASYISRMVLERGLPSDTLLNVNIPNVEEPKMKGIQFSRQGRRTYDNAIKETFDPWQRKHYWIGGGNPVWEGGIDTDSNVVEAGHISITPIHLDLTNYDALVYLQKKWRDSDLFRRFPAKE
jgi:5'-nucleotidase